MVTGYPISHTKNPVSTPNQAKFTLSKSVSNRFRAGQYIMAVEFG
jgi:hypothetical protein